jgi:hypothetical protein
VEICCECEKLLHKQLRRLQKAGLSAPYQFVRPAAKVGSPRFAFAANPGKIKGQGARILPAVL